MLHRLRPTFAGYRRLALAGVFVLCAVVVTGGAVRLTGSGLGCPDWPSCTAHSLVSALQFHPMVEFVNRIISVLTGVLVGLLAVGSLLLPQRRRDLVLLAWSLVAGFLGQAVVGGLSVLYHLAPGWIMAHFLLSMVLVWIAVALWYRSDPGFAGGTRRPVPPLVLGLARLLAVAAAIVLVAGTVVTGTGPHAGSPDVQRLPFRLATVAQLHADLAMFLCGLVVATVVALRFSQVPSRAWRFGHALVILVILQAALGFTQYFLHLPAGLVELHIAGATAIWATTIGLNFALTAPAGLPAPATARPRDQAAVGPPRPLAPAPHR